MPWRYQCARLWAFGYMFFLLLLSFLVGALALSQDYSESLDLQPLPGNHLLSNFRFKGDTSLAEFENGDFRFFSRSLGQILQHTRTRELHLRFSSGKWDAAQWGPSPSNGFKEGGTGVELWAWVDGSSKGEAEKRWFSLTSLLSGLFCASINFIDSTRTVSPLWTFDFEGSMDTKQVDDMHLFHGMLPHEVVCTENLTPFLKLLPCKGRAGISSLINGHRLFESSWQTMALDVRTVCVEGGNCHIEFEQSVDIAIDLKKPLKDGVSRIPYSGRTQSLECDSTKHYHASDTCYPLNRDEEPQLALHNVFGRKISGICAPEGIEYAQNQVCIDVPQERNVTVLYAQEESELPKVEGKRCITLRENESTDISMPSQKIEAPLSIQTPPLLISRSIAGYGAERGSIEAVLENPTDSALTISYLESLPWFMRPYLSTLHATSVTTGSQGPAAHPFLDHYFKLGQDRVRGTHIELVLDVPANSKVHISYEFDKALLRYTEYPPDANRGFDVPPAVVRVLSGVPKSGPVDHDFYVRSTSLLLSLPTPDFSMPYNVIIFSSTVTALSFGGVFKMLTRRSVKNTSPIFLAIQRIKQRIRALLVKEHPKEE